MQSCSRVRGSENLREARGLVGVKDFGAALSIACCIDATRDMARCGDVVACLKPSAKPVNVLQDRTNRGRYSSIVCAPMLLRYSKIDSHLDFAEGSEHVGQRHSLELSSGSKDDLIAGRSQCFRARLNRYRYQFA